MIEKKKFKSSLVSYVINSNSRRALIGYPIGTLNLQVATPMEELSAYFLSLFLIPDHLFWKIP